MPCSTDEVLTTVSCRASLLDYLSDTSAEKPRIVSELEMPRSTVDYAIRDLLSARLVKRSADGYHLTTFGELTRQAYERYRSTVDDTRATIELLDELPAGTVDDSAPFRDAAVVTPDPSAPDRPFRRFVGLVREASHVVGFTPVVVQQYVDVFHERLTDGTMTAELVLSPDVLERLASNYAEQFGEMLHTGRLDVRETDRTLPFGLAVCDCDTDEQRVVLVVHTSHGCCGLIENTTERSVEWGREQYRQYREPATALATAATVR
ncbi:helix-turn-helix transcriptional regulator [Halomarina oriensis]|uniref:Uncharacterized protein n=1 Tax=Halomarina oriensis TaxID=671145 RepID=A0A6B0GKB2_9EURY|nr:hypothetical protein [Halomarina oriensis]MWG33849.1 hypothetical protein [Halomarina oriensis]